MSPLASIFVIMLFTVVYNESQFVEDYPDDYQKMITKITMPIDLCDIAPKRKMCQKTSKWREFLKNIDYLRDDAQEFSSENVRDYFEDDSIKIRNGMTKHKRNNLDKCKECFTLRSIVKLGDGDYYPGNIGNVTCDIEANKKHKLQNCQPVTQKVTVLSRHSHRSHDVPGIIPQGCWMLEDIPIHIGCECGFN